MKCPDCGTEMKPLALSMYCPNDCDRKVQEEIDPEKTPLLIKWDTTEAMDLCSAGSSCAGTAPAPADPDGWWDGLGWDADTD